MLSELIIEDFVLVERAAFSFGERFTAITGATGAGKSLFVKALKLVLGARADTSVVRPGAKQAVIQAFFEIQADTLKELARLGIETDGELIIRRIIPGQGRGRIFINGILSSLQQLKTITAPVLSIASQHEFQNLLKKEMHQELLDEFGALEKARIQVGQLHAQTSALRRTLKELRKKNSQIEEEKARIEAEQKLIDETRPRINEEEQLEHDRMVLKSAAELRSVGEDIYHRLYAARGSITEELAACRANMEKMASLDPGLKSVKELLDSVTFQADDIAISIRDYLQNLPLDISRLNQVEERLYRLQALKRKFGPELADVISYRKSLDAELEKFDRLELEMQKISRELDKVEKKLCRAAQELSEKRKEIAPKMERSVLRELSALDLDRASFHVNIHTPTVTDAAAIGPRGADRVEFYFSANPGQPERPLAQVASGGELSRILLALKTITGSRNANETLLFDEIDAGLGGEIAENVGKKLKEMSRHQQVIAITHFPQIAAMADMHITVEKIEEHGKTITTIRHLSDNERLDEIVRMLGGETDTARKYAGELLGTVLRRT
ncbi:MAG: DNA repair protein RecN [Thermodesulfatator sp.]|nr:MAG: DNA repair protein RecN [Thermodesulfatator sp.]